MLNVGATGHFATCRAFLRERYSEEVLAAALGIAHMGDFDKRDPRLPIRDVVARCLFAGAAVPAPEFHRAVPAKAYDALAALGLLEHDGGALWCPFIVYPTHGVHLVSDRFLMPDGSPAPVDREFVYFALTANTQAYLAMLPDTSCRAFLDMGSGCGAAALVQAEHAEASCAVDISPRSTLFARFNALLNGLDRVEALEGSLYEPVRGRKFDRIGCHPPYDISSSSPWTFADGGDDGEFVIRNTVAGLPDHLLPGGEFYALFRGADRKGRPLEMRVREWLGEKNGEFDVALVVRGTVGVQDYALSSVVSTTRDFAMYEEYLKRFEGLEVEQLVYANVLVRRTAAEGQPLTLRRSIGERCTWQELRWLLDWNSHAATFDLAGVSVRTAPDVRLFVTNVPKAGGLRPASFRLQAQTPFQCEIDVPEWVGVLLSDCVAESSVEALYAKMRERADLSREQFLGALKVLISTGAVHMASGSRITSSN